MTTDPTTAALPQDPEPDIDVRPYTAAERAARDLAAAAMADDLPEMSRLVGELVGLPRHATISGTAPQVSIIIYRWICPLCQGAGRDDGGRCHQCVGRGMLTADDVQDVAAWEAAWGDELKPAPLPPALMRSPCVDCAFRTGSPEQQLAHDHSGAPPVSPADPFFCHHGMHRVGDGYESPAYAAGIPLGAMICRGWWNQYTGTGPAPDRPFRDPGGAQRPDTAPALPSPTASTTPPASGPHSRGHP